MEQKEFVVMVKPIGSLCNMRCSYCYYLEADNGAAPMQRMSEDVLEAFIRNYCESSAGEVISFTWHGGEPTLAGLPFYQKAVELEKRYCPPGKQVWNNLQTNGLLLDEEWTDFLARERFDVGISIDGAEWLHDLHRKDTVGEGTYQKTAAAIRRLQERGIQPDLLCTVTEETAKNGVETYQALKELGTGWMQFIPIVVREKREKEIVTKESVRPASYGEFLKDVFAWWLFHDMGRQHVQLFDELALTLAGGQPRLCNLRETCGNVLVVERDGGVYSCDHFVDQAHWIGNVTKERLSDLLESGQQREFAERKKTGLTQECLACPWLRLCHGGCPKDRFVPSSEGEEGHFYLCEGIRSFFSYAGPRLKRAMELSGQRIAGLEIERRLIEEERQKFGKINRNSPCPCGSGRKAKSCCLRRV